MIKTYEVHDSSSQDDDEMVEFDPEVVENLNWWQKCFVPKYPVDSCHREEDTFPETHVPIEAQGNEDKEEGMEESRGRLNSEDVTVSTNLTTPPGTPDVKKNIPVPYSTHSASNSCRNNNTSYNPLNSVDLETLSMRNVISAIDEEESEDVDRIAEEDKESGKIAGSR